MIRVGYGWLALAALAAISSLSPAAEPAAGAKKLGPAIKLAAAGKGKISPASAASLAAARTANRATGEAEPAVAAVSEEADTGGVAKYAVINLEFADAAACANFKQDDVHVFARNDRFADVFALNTDATVDALSQAPACSGWN